MKTQSGFTILELVITFSLIGVIVTTVSMRYPNQNLKLEAKKIISLLEASATEALQREEQIKLVLEPNLITLLQSEQPLLPTRKHKVTSTVKIVAQTQNSEISFYPTSAATPTTFKLLNNSQTCSIAISIRGRIRSVCS